MKNQRLVEAMKGLKVKRIKVRSGRWTAYWSARSVSNLAYWSAYWLAYDSTTQSASYSAKLDKPKVLEIIKARLK